MGDASQLLSHREPTGGWLLAPSASPAAAFMAWPSYESFPPTQDSGSMPASPGEGFGVGWGLDSLTLLWPG